MTPQEAVFHTYRKTGDMEAAYLAGYTAEGLIGKGKPPSNIGDMYKGFGKSGGFASSRKEVAESNNRKVMRFLRKNGSVSTTDYIAIGMKYETLKRAIRRLATSGKIVMVEKHANKPCVYKKAT